MVVLLYLLALFSLNPDIEISIPEYVQAGDSFSVDITITGMDSRSVQCEPVYSSGLRFLGSSSMHSFSSMSTSSGRSINTETILSMNFMVIEEGTHTIGPLRITSNSRLICEIPADSINAAAGTPNIETSQNTPESEILAWIELEIDTTGQVYPGQSFQVEYYIYKTQRNSEIVDLYLDAAEYASSNLIEDTNELRWVRCKNGNYKTWLATLEITPAFACSLELPVLSGRIGLPGGFYRGSLEQRISSEGNWLAVYPFPEEGQPENFSGITGEIFFNLDVSIRGYSQAGEKCVQLAAEGPGISQLETMPFLTVSGPGTLLPGPLLQEPVRGEVTCRILIEPDDSGTVIIGPDSIAWFDTELKVYHQAFIPSCTLSVHAPHQAPVIEIDFREANGNSSLLLILSSILLLTAIVVLLLKKRFSRNRFIPEIDDAQDPEELLTALEYKFSRLLTGSPCYMGSEELDEALDARDVDNFLKGRLLRHWKDMELMLSGRKISADQLDRLKSACIELVQELSSDLNS